MAEDIAQWLDRLDLGQYAQAFADNGIDIEALPHLREEDFKRLGVLLGHMRRLQAAIEALSADEPPTRPVPPPRQEPEPRPAEAERRQLTVMFVDMVGSTALSAKLDPEDLRHILGRYQDAVAGTVTRYGGHVAKYLGDGVLAYFGWPQAYEDQAERAVHAGLDSVRAVHRVQVSDDVALQARVGISTGQVVVGDLVVESGRDAAAVSGETPNLAARLQQVAAPGQVVIGEDTYRLVGRSFAVNDLGGHNLKGFDNPVRAWGVTSETMLESRFEATHDIALTQMIGRNTELQLLLDRWQLARGGEGQVVLISGEAGIGKSRLLQGLHDKMKERDHFPIRYQCSPYHANSALYPATQQLERAAGITPNEDVEAKLDKLEGLLGQTGGDMLAEAPLFADLLSLPAPERYGPLTLSPEQIKERLLEALVMQLLSSAEDCPVLFLFEDTHWVDPTSKQLLVRIIGRIQRARVLLIITHRPEWPPPPSGHNHVTSLQLNRLGRLHGADIVRAIAGQTVSDDVVMRIVERTDGVPLFIEELTKSVVESSLDIADVNIPATLQASLTERLDRLGEAKEIAQISAVVGREAPHALLVAVAEKSASELSAAVDSLIQSELMFCWGEPPDAVYSFKHALVRDTAYDSLLFASRRKWHRRIGEALETQFKDRVEVQPELLGHHFTEAGLAERAIPYWLRAGQRAAHRSASAEAIAHLTKGLELLESQPATPERDAQELDLKIVLGPALLSVRGFSDPEARMFYQQIRELSVRLGDLSRQFAATWGLWICNVTSDGFPEACLLSANLIELSGRQTDQDQILQAHHAAWTTDLMGGRYAACWDHASKGMRLYDPEQHRAHKFTYGGHDPGVCSRNFGSLALWTLGRADLALATSAESVTLAERIEHPNSLAQALTYNSMIRILRGEPREAMQRAKTATDLSNERNIGTWKALSVVLGGWAAVETGELVEGLQQMRHGMEHLRAGGAKTLQLRFVPPMGDFLARAGAIDEALALLGEAHRLTEETDARWGESEIHRVRGKVLLRKSVEFREEALTELQKALEIARRQKSKSYELLAAITLARVYGESGQRDHGRDLLAPVYALFTEGFETASLREAQNLLDELT
jgi:class 3 adenylate cyclase/predicted ATPase